MIKVTQVSPGLVVEQGPCPLKRIPVSDGKFISRYSGPPTGIGSMMFGIDVIELFMLSKTILTFPFLKRKSE
jgi:hypothetical protein